MLPNLFKIDNGNIVNVNYLKSICKECVGCGYVLHFIDKTEIKVTEEEYNKLMLAISLTKGKEKKK